MSELVTTITARTMDELRRARDAAAESADLVELRLDSVDRPDVAAALEGRRTPVVLTCRPRWEGGLFDGSETERRRVLLAAVQSDAEFVDVEVRSEFAAELIAARGRRGIIASLHAFEPAARDLEGDLRTLRATGAEVVKLAVAVDTLTATLPLFDLAARARREAAPNQHHVLIAMGPRGVHTRVLAAWLGNRWSYAGDAVAPGQMPPAKILNEFRYRRITPGAALYGIAGNPVGHSLSPVMHNAGFEQLGIDAAYVPFEARDSEDFVAFARSLNISGASITAPLKVDLMPYMDECDALAMKVGAVNTFRVEAGRWIGANTDVEGAVAPLRARRALRGARVAVLGAGGAARAVAVGLTDAGAEVTLCARRIEQAREVAAMTGASAGPFPPAPGTWDVLVNATTAGRHPGEASPMAGVALGNGLVFDLVYSPPDTPLLRQARAAGCQTIGGIEMLIAQAERQFEIWTGQAPAPGLFRAAAEGALDLRQGSRS